MPHITLAPDQAATAALIQTAIDDLAAQGGGTLTLPAMDLTLDRGLQLHTGIHLTGQGPATILRKGPSTAYPLTGYHNYGMHDVPIADPTGLQPGMTVSIKDDARGGFYSTFTRITAIDGPWVRLDTGINADYLADANPRLTTAHPLIYALNTRDIAVSHLHLDGNLAQNPHPMDACRGAALYFYQTTGITVDHVTERNYHGEGLGFQMCSNVTITHCTFDANTGNGYHPGAGSTKVIFDHCTASHNQNAGFYFCVRATHITIRHSTFTQNAVGISINTRDCYNIIHDCTFDSNTGPGITIPARPTPIQVYAIHIHNCHFIQNDHANNHTQILIGDNNHDIIIDNSTFTTPGPAIKATQSAKNIYLANNTTTNNTPLLDAPPQTITTTRPSFPAGHTLATPKARQHLPPDTR